MEVLKFWNSVVSEARSPTWKLTEDSALNHWLIRPQKWKKKGNLSTNLITAMMRPFKEGMWIQNVTHLAWSPGASFQFLPCIISLQRKKHLQMSKFSRSYFGFCFFMFAFFLKYRDWWYPKLMFLKHLNFGCLETAWYTLLLHMLSSGTRTFTQGLFVRCQENTPHLCGPSPPGTSLKEMKK